MAGKRKLGGDQAINFTIRKEGFGATPEDRKVCLLGLAGASHGVTDRESFERFVERRTLNALKNARENGQELLERLATDTRAQDYHAGVLAIAEATGGDVADIADGLAQMDIVVPEPAKEGPEPVAAAVDLAWGLIANAYGGDWELATDEWKSAASRWRDEYVGVGGAVDELADVPDAD